MSLIKQIKLETPESTTAYDIGAVATNVSLQNPITVEETQYTNVESALNAINNKSGGGGSADTSIIAEDFSTSKSYAVGDYVVYNGDLYRCSTAHSAGAWDASHFTQITVTSELDTKMTKGKDYVTAGRSINSTAGTKSTAEGQGNTASGNYSHVEGNSNTASGQSSHAEGQNCTASKSQSHAEGSTTTASGKYAHSEGGATTASHEASHAEGYYTKTGASYQHVGGKFNVGKSTTLFEVGNGTSDNVRANAFEISNAGDVVAAGDITDGSGNTLSNIVIDIADLGISKIGISQIGIAGGVASLDLTGKVPSAQLPSYVDEIIEGYLNDTDGKFYEESTYITEIVGETGKIYVTLDTNKTYRWSGSAFVEISESLALGRTSSTAFPGDAGKAIEDVIPNTATTSNKLVTASDIPSAYTSDPEMDGIASAGSSTAYAKGDHVHPSDTSKANQAELAPEFDATRTSSNPYYVGDVVVYDGELYRFVLGHYGAWNASDVVKITVGEQIAAYCTNIIAIPSSGWSSTATDGYYSQTITTPVYSTTYNPHFSISGASATVLPTDAESAAYRAIQHPNGYIEQVDSTHITVYAKVKPDDTFYVKMAGYGMGLQVEGSDIDPYDSTPAMDGVGSAGVSDDYARGDHVHPSDISKADKEDILVYGSTWTSKTWGEETENLYGSGIWTDGNNIYLSAGEHQYVLDKSTGTWFEKTWYGLTEFSGSDVWTDGDNIYLSSISDGQYVLDKTTSTWSTKTWSGVSSPLKSAIWTDGENVYMSQGSSAQFVLDKSTSTWSTKTWNGYTNISGVGIWTDGDNIYYSAYSSNYVLDKATDTWSAKTWTGLTDFTGCYVWTDGNNIYYSEGSTQYILNKSTSTWSSQSWTTLTNFNKDNIWTDGENIYCSKGISGQYELSKVFSGDIIIEDSIIIKANGDIQGAGEIYDDAGNALSEKFDANSFVLQKFRVTVTASNWSSTATSGYYTYALTLPYPINTYKEFSMGLTGSADGTDPTAAESAAYSLVNYFDANDGTGVTSATLRAKTKPTTTFYIMISGYYMQKNAATSGVALDISTANVLDIEWVGRDAKTATWLNGGYDFDGSAERKLYFIDYEFTIYASSWSSTVNSNGYYTNTRNMPGVITSYSKPDIALTASSGNTLPTATQIAAYNLVNYFYLPDDVSAQAITAYAKTKPTSDFDIHVKGVWIRS